MYARRPIIPGFVLTILVFTSILAVATLGAAGPAVYSVKKLAESKAQTSYVEDPVTITVTIRKGVTVKVHIPKGNAYAATAIAIYGDYDESRGKFIYISGGLGYRTKSWCSLTCFEKYDITVLETSFDLRKYKDGDWYKFVAKGKAKYKVTHCTWWISCDDKETFPHSLKAIAYVPKSRV
ncbi:hypothetical protein [Pyrolobus fumarii]|nr:hypothetical protein [Pyrolobus fumarii]